MQKLVSILIPAYNSSQWVEFTLASALNQTWGKKEIIIVDDGSSDNTYDIISRYKNYGVKIIRQENKGGCAARNEAYKNSNGDYIQWLDADDILDENKISIQMKCVEEINNEKVLFTSSWANFYRNPQKGKFIPNNLWKDLTPVDWITYKMGDIVWMNPASWLISRKLSELAGPWDENLRLDQDGEYITRVLLQAEYVKFVNEAKCYYRLENPKSVSKIRSKKSVESSFIASDKCINYLLSLENSARTREACIRYMQNRYQVYYPYHENLVEKANIIVNKLGGKLRTPRVNLVYKYLELVFGKKVKDNIKHFVKKCKIYFNIYKEKHTIL
jgi:glycosyltransferase involved in cell wall biosynthesis